MSLGVAQTVALLRNFLHPDVSKKASEGFLVSVEINPEGKARKYPRIKRAFEDNANEITMSSMGCVMFSLWI